MSLAWLEKWSRIKRLTWDEVQTRVRQELGKRMDTAFPISTFRLEAINLAETGAHGDFFFSPTDLPERVRLLRAHLPAEVDAILTEADEICRHRFRLLGYVDLDYGAEIDWHLDAVHGKRSPLKPWHKINFFDFAQIGDHKVTWELNRHQHLMTLAKAWLFTHDSRYTNELILQWNSWHRANPYPKGINWVSSLEVGFRSLSWIWVGQLLADCPELSGQFKSDLLRGLGLNGRYIERYLSTYFSPNTHLLGEAAEAETIPHAWEVYARTTSTDADEIHFTRAGIPTGLLSIPTRYLHSPSEICALDDVEANIRLIVAFAERLSRDQSFIR